MTVYNFNWTRLNLWKSFDRCYGILATISQFLFRCVIHVFNMPLALPRRCPIIRRRKEKEGQERTSWRRNNVDKREGGSWGSRGRGRTTLEAAGRQPKEVEEAKLWNKSNDKNCINARSASIKSPYTTVNTSMHHEIEHFTSGFKHFKAKFHRISQRLVVFFLYASYIYIVTMLYYRMWYWKTINDASFNL